MKRVGEHSGKYTRSCLTSKEMHAKGMRRLIKACETVDNFSGVWSTWKYGHLRKKVSA
jgi:hypothetical protein